MRTSPPTAALPSPSSSGWMRTTRLLASLSTRQPGQGERSLSKWPGEGERSLSKWPGEGERSLNKWPRKGERSLSKWPGEGKGR